MPVTKNSLFGKFSLGVNSNFYFVVCLGVIVIERVRAKVRGKVVGERIRGDK